MDLFFLFFFRFFDKSDFQYVEMDTDSAYMALSGPLESLVMESRREEFFRHYGEWFPKPYCEIYKEDFVACKLDGRESWNPSQCCRDILRYDTHTPGLFKEEFEGDGIVALNSKTYFCWGSEETNNKYSSKGLGKSMNKLTKDSYTEVLFSKQSMRGTNNGFLKTKDGVYTYSQLKTGLTYFYAKRRVLPDGVSTENIEL